MKLNEIDLQMKILSNSQSKLLITTEKDKIKCGRKHFETIEVDYDVATDIRDSNT
jgi:tetraacyldisaccharide-1-P 4'-kinase